MSFWSRALPITGCIMAICAGCGGDMTAEETEEDGQVGSARQAEVITCPADLAPSLANVKYGQELLITNPSVVDDVCRTNWLPSDPSCTNQNVNGRWSFWYLMSQMAGSNNPSRFVLKWLESFEENPVVNGQTLAKRNVIRSLVIDPWRNKSGCVMGLKYDDAGGACTLKGEFAPFRLLAIVNRVDLRSGGAGSFYGGGDAGESRFIFGFTNLNSLDASGKPNPIQATAILEYRIPTASRSGQQWALDWRSLGNSNWGSFPEAYKTALQTITDRFVRSAVAIGNPNNGSAISQVRSDEFSFDPNVTKVWSMREFKLACLPNQACGTNDKFLVNATTAQTPRDDKNQTMDLQDYLTQNQAFIEAGSHVVPASFNGPFLGGDSTSKQFASAFQWNLAVPDPALDDSRRIFAFSTCNGCHYLETDNTGNLHVKNRKAGVEAQLSSFLTQQITVFNDPSGMLPEYNEPLRRKCELLALAAGKSAPVSTTTGRPH